MNQKLFILIIALGTSWTESLPIGGAFASSSSAESTATPSPVIIVHPNNPLTEIDPQFLSRAFLKKKTEWPHGEVIKPVDLKPTIPIRQVFSKYVLGRTVPEVKVYWQQNIFSGHKIPPPEFDAEEEVVAYILRTPGAIGYVSSKTKTAGSKILSLRK